MSVEELGTWVLILILRGGGLGKVGETFGESGLGFSFSVLGDAIRTFIHLYVRISVSVEELGIEVCILVLLTEVGRGGG